MEEAEVYFHQALAMAGRQQAKSLELRAAMSLARLWQQQDKQVEAYELLAPVYGWLPRYAPIPSDPAQHCQC